MNNFDNSLSLFVVIFAAFALFVSLCYLILYFFSAYKLFKKAGEEGWKAFIPFYNKYIFMTKVCKIHWAWYVLSLVIGFILPITRSVSIIIRLFINAICFYNLGLKLHKDPIESMIFGSFLNPFMIIFYGLDSSTYDKKKGVKDSGIF